MIYSITYLDLYISLQSRKWVGIADDLLYEKAGKDIWNALNLSILLWTVIKTNVSAKWASKDARVKIK